jgi:membrane associated rhomboid family serine protease
MIPIRDEMPTRHMPYVTYGLIAANILVYVLMWLFGANQEALVYQFALIPANLTTRLTPGNVFDIFTSMFMHAGLLHLAGNMLYLWIFGDNVEDSLGPFKYLIFYFVGGAVAAVTQVLTNPGSQIPTVGASGAIGAVLGAYLVLYPNSRIMTLIFLGFYIRMTLIPASIVLGVWFVLQLFSGLLSLGGPDVGGVAFWAHIGGFLSGVALAFLLANRRRSENPVNW